MMQDFRKRGWFVPVEGSLIACHCLSCGFDNRRRLYDEANGLYGLKIDGERLEVFFESASDMAAARDYFFEPHA